MHLQENYNFSMVIYSHSQCIYADVYQVCDLHHPSLVCCL